MNLNEPTGRPDPLNKAISRRRAIHLAGGAVLATAAGVALAHSGAPETRLVSGSTQLLIPEGPDWWNTSSIWVVPGTDPNGSPGAPVAGQPAYVWARISNTSAQSLNNVQVRFYWANPAFEMLFSAINHIGTAYATIPAKSPADPMKGTQDVLCLVPWQVQFVNGGKECLVVAASLPGDAPLPDLIDIPGCPQVAQKNLTVWKTPPGEWDWLELKLIAPRDQARSIRVSSSIGGEVTREALQQFQLDGARSVSEQVVDVGFALRPPTETGGIGEREVTVNVPAGGTVPLFVTVRRRSPLARDQYQLVTVSGHQDSRLLGGVSFVITGRE